MARYNLTHAGLAYFDHRTNIPFIGIAPVTGISAVASAHQPLSPLTMSILVALAKGDLHGYALMQEIDAQTDGALRPGTGSLYAALERLVDERLVIESPRQPSAGADARRKYFRVTAAGRAAARAEAARMVRVLEEAQASSLIRDLPTLREAR